MDKCENRWKKSQVTTLMIIDSQAVQNTCNASVESKGFCSYKLTNGIKRHLAVDTLGFPFFTHCTKANLSDDAGLLFDVNAQYRLLPLETSQHPQDHNLVRSRLSPRVSDAGTRAGVSSDYEENQIWIVHQAIQTRAGSNRKVWICSSHCSVGNWAIQCLDGALQDSGQEPWENLSECHH